MKGWYDDSQLRLWSERNRGQWNPDDEVVPNDENAEESDGQEDSSSEDGDSNVDDEI